MDVKENNREAITFVERKSLLTELFEKKCFKFVPHAFWALLLGFIINDCIALLGNNAESNFGLSIIKNTMQKVDVLIISWALIYGVNLLIYVCFQCWVNLRRGLKQNVYIKLWDSCCLAMLLTYFVGALYFVPIAVKKLDLAPISSGILLMVQITSLLKSYAFIRSNAPKMLKSFKPDRNNATEIPTISNCMYFSIAPTLIYRHQYPRTNEINWKYVVKHVSEGLALIWLQSIVIENYFLKHFKNGKELNWYAMMVFIHEKSPAGGLIFLSSFYVLLHCYTNCLAELSRFADRKFYEDWWSATNFVTYYRTWNTFVGNWLYQYVYKDMNEIVTPGNKTMSKLAVFLISAFVHEYVFYFTLGVFLPFMSTLLFASGVIFGTYRMSNVIFLYFIALGVSLIISLYAAAYYAQQQYISI